MLTFSNLPTFHGTPPDGVWHQQGSLARYVKNGVAAVVDANGRVTILPSCLDLVVAYRDTLPECFAWAEGEVERLVGDLATFKELCSYKHWTTQHMPLHPDVEKLLTGDVLRAELGKAADAVEGVVKLPTVQAQRDLRERNHRAISAARLKDVHTNGGWKPPGDAGGGDALREVGGGRQRILVNNDGRVSLIDTSVPGGYSKLDFETAEEALEAADEQVASKTGYAPVISLVDLKPGDTIRHKGGGDALVVTANYGNRVTAVRTADVTNPCEWQVWREK